MHKFITITAQNYFSSYHGIPMPCWRDILFNLVNSISVGVCFFLSLYFVDDLHLSMVVAGVLMSSYGIGTVIGGVLSGKLCDSFSPYLILVLSLILQGTAFIFLVTFNSIESLIAILFMLGVSTYSFKTANNVSMLSHCCGNQGLHLKTINISHAASNFGLGISGIAVGVLAAYGYTCIFSSAGAILLLSALYMLVIKERSASPVIFDRMKQHAASESDGGVGMRNINVLLLALASIFFVGLIIAQLGSTYPVYVKEAFPALGTKAVSALFILDTVLIVLFQAPLANYYGRYNTVLVMGLGAFMMGLGMLVLSFSSTFSLAMVSCGIWTTGEMLFIPTAQLLCYQNGNSRRKGQSMGVFQSTFAVSTVVGPTIGGYIYSVISPNAVWYISLVIGILCMTSCMLMMYRNNNLSFSRQLSGDTYASS